jgi:UDP-3-O-[3-hydroxymyristoyl] glucosamine N-acyltransferase
MKFNKVHSLQEIANLLKCESIGDKNFEILGMNEIHVVEKVISFCRSKYYDKALKSAATIILINKKSRLS